MKGYKYYLYSPFFNEAENSLLIIEDIIISHNIYFWDDMGLKNIVSKVILNVVEPLVLQDFTLAQTAELNHRHHPYSRQRNLNNSLPCSTVTSA